SSVSTFRMSASWGESATGVVARHARTVARLEEIPGVESAAVSQTMPAGVDFPPGEFSIVGRDTSVKTYAHGRAVSAGYFRTLRIPILQGETCRNDPKELSATKTLVTRQFAVRFNRAAAVDYGPADAVCRHRSPAGDDGTIRRPVPARGRTAARNRRAHGARRASRANPRHRRRSSRRRHRRRDRLRPRRRDRPRAVHDVARLRDFRERPTDVRARA